MNDVCELYCHHVSDQSVCWTSLSNEQNCSYLGRRCLKGRKSEPLQTIGTCVVEHSDKKLLACPHRLLENRSIFIDCIHLLTRHEPGNEYHVVSEIGTASGNVDYILASVKDGKVKDFVGIELQTMDTTGTVFPYRERFLHQKNVPNVNTAEMSSAKPFGINWKMTAKTILVQLHHKIGMFEMLNKNLVLVLQDHLLEYMKREFSFAHFSPASIGDPMHFHAYRYGPKNGSYGISLAERVSTDSAGVARCLGLNSENRQDLELMLKKIEKKISDVTLLRL